MIMVFLTHYNSYKHYKKFKKCVRRTSIYVIGTKLQGFHRIFIVRFLNSCENDNRRFINL